MMFGMGIFWIAFLALIVWGVRIFVGQTDTGGRTGGGHGDSALSILRERYARGEIEREEFEARRRELSR